MRAATIVLALLLAACGGGGNGGAGALGEVPDAIDLPAGCEPAQRVAIEGSSHVEPPQRVEYKTNPPTSGNHYSVPNIGPAAPGVYAESPSDEGLVHNLEHGHVIFWHAPDLSKTQLEELDEVVTLDPRFRLLVPRAGMPSRVAFTSWGVIQRCAVPTALVGNAAKAFARRFQQKAPEDIPGRPLA